MALRSRVAEELERLREAAHGTSLQALRDGSWLVPVVSDALDPYARLTDRRALQSRHGVDDTDALAEACIAAAQRRALVAGGLSAGVYASVVAGALATGGFAAAVAIPTAVAAFTVDLWYTARVQLRLAWDLAAVYGHPVDLDDPDQAVALCRLAFGIDADSAAATVVAGVLPEASRFGTRALTTAGRVASEAWIRVMGQSLVQRGVARFAVPAVGVPMCAAVNHVTTGRAGRAAQALLRGRVRARELAVALDADLEQAPVLSLEALLWIVGADGRARGSEIMLVRGLAETLSVPPSRDLQAALTRDPDALLADVARAPATLREPLYEAAVQAAALDGVLHTEEDRRLRQLAEACGVTFDPMVVAQAIMAARSN